MAEVCPDDILQMEGIFLTRNKTTIPEPEPPPPPHSPSKSQKKKETQKTQPLSDGVCVDSSGDFPIGGCLQLSASYHTMSTGGREGCVPYYGTAGSSPPTAPSEIRGLSQSVSYVSLTCLFKRRVVRDLFWSKFGSNFRSGVTAPGRETYFNKALRVPTLRRSFQRRRLEVDL